MADVTVFSKIKNSEEGNYLFLLDGFDELKVPKNLYVTNRLSEWKCNLKVIITTRMDYLKPLGNYQRFFSPINANPEIEILNKE